jgi:hypothetical protein
MMMHGIMNVKIRRKCRQNLKFVSDVEGNTLMEDISTSLNADLNTLLNVFLKNSKDKSKVRRWNFED